MKWLSFLTTLLFSAAIFANPEVRIYQDDTHLSPLPSENPKIKNVVRKVIQNNDKEQSPDSSTETEKHLPETTIPSQKLSVDEQIKRIDAEILLLKAELARKNADIGQVKAYVDSLKAMTPDVLSSTMQARLQTLLNYLDSQTNSPIQDKANLSFVYDPKHIAVLLPLTGELSEIGQAIQKGLEASLPQTDVKYYDTQAFDSIPNLWSLVKLTQPSLVIGPLQPSKAQALNDLNIGVPTLLLNQVELPRSHVRSLSLNRESATNTLIQQLLSHHLKGVMLLVDETPASQSMLAAFQKHWAEITARDSNLTDGFRISVQTVKGRTDNTVAFAVNANQSKIRKNWLQKVIRHRLVFEERSRQDLDVVVSFLTARQAIQVVPLLKFFHLGSLLHYWLPSELPSHKDFNKNLGYWRHTYALLPKYYVESAENLRQSDQRGDDQVGIFYAFGSLAARVVEKIDDVKTLQMQSELGNVRFDDQRNPTIMPNEYWLNKGRVSPVSIQ